MRNAIQWIAMGAVVLMLYYADLKHMATSDYNTFLLLLGMATGLVLILKLCRPKPQQPGATASPQPPV